MKNPYILRWNKNGMVLSDGSPEKVFTDHDEAMLALEEEIAKVKFPLARKVIDIGNSLQGHDKIAELEVVREFSTKILLYGVSDYYLIPIAVNPVERM